MLYGRDAERARIAALLDGARESRSGSLVVRGEPGIGKTALLEDTRERATDMHVLSARGVESESELPFAALHQLLRPALGHLDKIPGPQAEALSGALGLGDGGGHERFLVFAGCLSLLSELADRRPVLCLVDDAHWLDVPSADALRFVSRRLDAEGIVVLFAAREGDVRRFEAADVTSLPLEGLDEEAAAALLTRVVGVEAVPAVRERLLEQTRGNALALVEVPAQLSRAQLAGSAPLPEALPMSGQVESIFLERVRRLPEETQRMLLLAAADDTESAAVVARAAEAFGVGTRAFDAAEEAGLIAIHGTRLEFRHPLVRSAVYEGVTSSDRRAAHKALADALDDGEADRRAWHLAASVLDHNEDVVAALEAAAERARERSGHAAAAKALERAAELSADPADRGRRLVAAARAASFAGADGQAVALAEAALPLVDDPVLRAEIARVQGHAERNRGRPGDGFDVLLAAARDVAPVEPRKALELLLYVFSAGSESGRNDGMLAAAELAGSIEPPDEESAFLVQMITGLGAMVAGDSARGAALLKAALASASDQEARYAYWAVGAALWLGDDAGVARQSERAGRLARRDGAFGLLAEALSVQAFVASQMQRFDEALVAAEESLGYSRELGADNLTSLPLVVLATVDAVRGHDDRAVERCNELLRLAAEHALPLRAGAAMRVLALLDLGRARWADALERYQAVMRPHHGEADQFALLAITPDLVEAAVRSGNRDVAEEAVPAFAEWAGHANAPWALPRVACCHALLAEGEEATAHYEEALALAGTARPLDLARIRLLYGEHLRRERRRADARLQLRAALEGFEAIQAEPWAERARAELRATGETARKRDPSTVSQLTPQELQIARLVAEGHSNKEVAAQLFLSPRTIDSHLRNVFAKLGLSSRTQLARLALADGEGSADAAFASAAAT